MAKVHSHFHTNPKHIGQGIGVVYRFFFGICGQIERKRFFLNAKILEEKFTKL
jgi:hypothetical protein